MLWLYDIKSHFILIYGPHAKIESIIKRLSPSLLPTVRAGEGGCDVTAKGHKYLSSSRIFYMFLDNAT